jgi:hypothetical protein
MACTRSSVPFDLLYEGHVLNSMYSEQDTLTVLWSLRVGVSSMSGDCCWVLRESKGGHVPGGSGEQLEGVREYGQAVFQDAVVISADTLPRRTEHSGSVWSAAWIGDAFSISVGSWRSEKDAASVDSYCVC